MSIAMINEVLGAEADANRIGNALLADKVNGETYKEETFKAHLEAILEHGEGYLSFIENMAAQAELATMYGFVISAGPNGVYGLISSMGQAGLLDKKKVASAAKMSTKVKTERAWFRQVWDELAPSAFDYLEAQFADRKEEFAKRFPEIADCDTLWDVLWTCQKSTLMCGVAEMPVEQTGTNAALALGFRVDAHSAARNGGWDYKLNDGAGGYTKAYHDKQAKVAAKAESDAAGEDEDTGDDNSE